MVSLSSGLDSSSSKQCISLLKELAKSGRTVICTIHQPSATLFEMFDHIYAVYNGRCLYSGGTDELIPFLAKHGLHCPQYQNPADYCTYKSRLSSSLFRVPILIAYYCSVGDSVNERICAVHIKARYCNR